MPESPQSPHITDPTSPMSLRICVGREGVHMDRMLAKPQENLAGYSMLNAPSKITRGEIAWPYYKRSIAFEVICLVGLATLVYSELIKFSSAIFVYLFLSLLLSYLTLRAINKRYKEVQTSIGIARNLVNRCNDFFDKFSSPEPFHVWMLDVKMKLLEDEGLVFSEELKSRVKLIIEGKKDNNLADFII